MGHPPAAVNLCIYVISGAVVAMLGVGGVGMNKVASTTWISILILFAIVITALALYNR